MEGIDDLYLDGFENIYVLTYLPTGKKYVGKTSFNDDGLRRLKLHYARLKKGKHPSKQFQTDYNTFGGGLEQFSMKVVDRMETSRMAKDFDAEKRLMIKLKTYDEKYGYNAQDPSMRRVRKKEGLPPKSFYLRWANR